MLGIGIAIGIPLGMALGILTVRYGMTLGEAVAFGQKDGQPVFTQHDTPLERSHTGTDERDLDVEVVE